MPSLIPPVPERENPGAVVAAVVLVTGNFEPSVNPVGAALAVGAAVVFANPVNEPNTGVAAELLVGAEKPRESPVAAGVAAVVVPPNLIPPPRVSPPEEAVAGATPKVSPVLGVAPAPLAPRVKPLDADVAGVLPLPNVNAGVGVTAAGAVVLVAPRAKPCDGANPNVKPPA